MNIKTITNQSSLTIIIIAIMLLISLGNAQAQTCNENNIAGYKTTIEEIEVALIPSGTFTRSDGAKVTLSSFYMMTAEVTQALWRKYMKTNFSSFSSCGDCPVENVSWNDVQPFIDSLRKYKGKQWRLPTEAEWEYAAMGGQNFTYAGSNTIDSVAWYSNNSSNKTHPVKEKKPMDTDSMI